MQPSPPPIAGTFHLAKLKLRALKNNSPHPPSPSLASAVLLSASGNLTTADTSRQWDHTAFAFWWRAYFTSHGVLEVPPWCGVCPNATPFEAE